MRKGEEEKGVRSYRDRQRVRMMAAFVEDDKTKK